MTPPKSAMAWKIWCKGIREQRIAGVDTGDDGAVVIEHAAYLELLEQARRMRAALKADVVVEDECEECGTFSGRRYEITPLKQAMEAFDEWCELRGVKL